MEFNRKKKHFIQSNQPRDNNLLQTPVGGKLGIISQYFYVNIKEATFLVNIFKNLSVIIYCTQILNAHSLEKNQDRKGIY